MFGRLLLLGLAALAALGLGGCGRLGFDERLASADAAPDMPTADAEMTCDPTAPFGAPVPIAELNTMVADGTLRLEPDERSGYFWSARETGNNDIFLAMRATVNDPWQVSPVQGLNTAANELDPAFTSTDTMFVFRRSAGGNDLFMAIRTAPGTFDPPTAIASLNSSSDDVQPFLQPNGDELIFSSTRTGNGDLYRSVRSGTNFSAPSRILELADLATEEGDPVLSADGLTLFFRSDRAAGFGSFNIFVATRSTTADEFGAPVLVDNVNSDGEDGPSWISLDGCRLYLSSDRAGSNDLYVATRGG
jgi:hypothetical protein